MEMIWPGTLYFLALIPVLIGIYIWMLRRRKRYAVRFSSISLLREVLPKQSRIRRHIPFVLFLFGLSSLVLAASKPVATVSVPANQTTIILAIDVSRSMLAGDIQPTRLEAAQETVQSFIEQQKPSTQIGIVAFAGFAELVQSPTNDQETLQSAVESLTTARRTAIGSGILKSLDAISEIDNRVSPSSSDPASGIQQIPVTSGEYVPEIIVLLTDGVSNSGPIPQDAAQQAADRGVRVYTIGYGTSNGVVPPDFQQFGGGQLFGSDPRFGNGFNGGFRSGIDEPTLKEIAKMTGGNYYSATSAGELHEVFQNLPTHSITHTETTEISVLFTAIGALMAFAAISLSMLWLPWP